MTSQSTASKSPEPGSLEAKFHLMISLPFDARVGRKHILVYGFILDWWHRKYGDALASVRHIVAQLKERDASGKGLYMGDVHSALCDLVAWGYLEQTKGKGRQASRYIPIWSPSVRETPNANSSVLATPNADVRATPNTTTFSVQDFPNEDPFTRTRSTDQGTEVNDLQDAPLASAGADAPPSPGSDPFDQLWSAYGVKRDRKAARAAYDRICPTAEQQAQMLSAASDWRAGAGAIQRKSLKKWLEEERWLEEAPKPFERPEKPASASALPANDNRAAPTPAVIVRTPETFALTITGVEVCSDGDFADLLIHSKTTEGGLRYPVQTIVLKHRDPELQDAGLRKFATLCHAVGLKEALSDPNDLVGKLFTVHTDEHGVSTFQAA